MNKNTRPQIVVFKAPTKVSRGVIHAVVLPFRVADNAPMPRNFVPAREPPGCNVYRLRMQLKLSQRALAEKADIDHTTVRRLELNQQGYEEKTLRKISKALGVDIPTLFLPPELEDWPTLSRDARDRVAESIKDAALAARYRVRKLP